MREIQVALGFCSLHKDGERRNSACDVIDASLNAGKKGKSRETPPVFVKNLTRNPHVPHYGTRALSGQTSMHAPHSAQESSTTALPSVMTIESRGQDETHSPQPVHLSNSTFTAMITNLCLNVKESAIRRTIPGYSNSVPKLCKRAWLRHQNVNGAANVGWQSCWLQSPRVLA